MARVHIPGTDQFTTVPDDWGPEQIDRHVNELKAFWAEHPDKAPVQVPAGAGEAQAAGATNPEGSAPAVPDASEQDDWMTWLDKQVKSAARGTGKAVAFTADQVANAGDVLLNDVKSYLPKPNFRDVNDEPALT